MLANTRLYVISQRQRHDVTSTLFAIQCNSPYKNCQFLKTGPADHVGVLQTPINIMTKIQMLHLVRVRQHGQFVVRPLVRNSTYSPSIQLFVTKKT